MGQTVNLTKVDLTQISDNINLIVEENSELKRLNINDISGDSKFIINLTMTDIIEQSENKIVISCSIDQDLEEIMNALEDNVTNFVFSCIIEQLTMYVPIVGIDGSDFVAGTYFGEGSIFITGNFEDQSAIITIGLGSETTSSEDDTLIFLDISTNREDHVIEDKVCSKSFEEIKMMIDENKVPKLLINNQYIGQLIKSDDNQIIFQVSIEDMYTVYSILIVIDFSNNIRVFELFNHQLILSALYDGYLRLGYNFKEQLHLTKADLLNLPRTNIRIIVGNNEYSPYNYNYFTDCYESNNLSGIERIHLQAPDNVDDFVTWTSEFISYEKAYFDKTLTKEDMAADAKAVGDAFSYFAEQFDNAINSMTTVIAVDDGEGNIELKPFMSKEALISEVLVGEY